jgi:hypothetical protein
MKSIARISTLAAALVTALLSPAVSVAQSPFDGTWRILVDQSRFSPKPMITFLSEGWFHCKSCNPQLDVKADGTDQTVIGQAYDTISVREIDSKTIRLLIKKAGNVLIEETQSVSSDGNTLTVTTLEHPANGGPPVKAETTAIRVGAVPAAINKTSGKWRLMRLTQSENGLLTTYKTNGDEFIMSSPMGESYTAKFNGRDYPVNGANGHNLVTLKRIDKNTIEELDKRDGIVVNLARMTVSADGRKMTIVDTNTMTDRTTTYIAIKQ